MKLPTLSLSRPLLDWLRNDSQWPNQDWRMRVALNWRAGLASLNQRLSEAQPTTAQELAPLLILGPWRSGTTVMHELLTAALGWPTPQTWQCMDATAFRLGGTPHRAATVARPMDGLPLGPLSPQEDEFALLSMGINSAYRSFWMPHRIPELHATLDQRHWLDDPRWIEPWESFLRAVAKGSEELILKSPNHTFRLQAILQRFPKARIVWMLRDPLAIFLSNRKMWGQMFAEHGLSKPDGAELDQFLTRALEASAEALDWAQNHVAPERVVCCSQEALQRQPMAQILRVLAHLGLPANEARLEQAIAHTQSGRVEHHADEIPPMALAAVNRLRATQVAMERPSTNT